MGRVIAKKLGGNDVKLNSGMTNHGGKKGRVIGKALPAAQSTEDPLKMRETKDPLKLNLIPNFQDVFNMSNFPPIDPKPASDKLPSDSSSKSNFSPLPTLPKSLDDIAKLRCLSFKMKYPLTFRAFETFADAFGAHDFRTPKKYRDGIVRSIRVLIQLESWLRE